MISDSPEFREENCRFSVPAVPVVDQWEHMCDAYILFFLACSKNRDDCIFDNLYSIQYDQIIENNATKNEATISNI